MIEWKRFFLFCFCVRFFFSGFDDFFFVKRIRKKGGKKEEEKKKEKLEILNETKKQISNHFVFCVFLIPIFIFSRLPVKQRN